jgi:integrase
MTNKQIIPLPASPGGSHEIVDPEYLEMLNAGLRAAGRAADKAASHHLFEDFRSRKAEATRRRHDDDLQSFEEFLHQVLSGTDLVIPDGSLSHDPRFWRGITWGLVQAYLRWCLARGYAISTINFRLSTIRCYAKLATQAGELDHEQLTMILAVQAYHSVEAPRIDEQRRQAKSPTRIGNKKDRPVELTDSDAEALIDQPPTPQGRRDTLLMALLLYHGLRVSEVALLSRQSFDLEEGMLKFYRPKVSKTQIHRLHPAALEAVKAYIEFGDAPLNGRMLVESNRDGSLDPGRKGEGITTRGLNDRVRVLGEKIGIPGLSPHDCRHYWATAAARAQTPLPNLQQAGGWSSIHMPMRYINDNQVANEGVSLTKKRKPE